MRQAVQRASVGIDQACLFLAKTALVGMVVTVLLQIWSRYGFDYPFTWTEELARYFMVWAGLLGATCAFKRRLDPAVVTVPEDKMTLARKAVLAVTVFVFLMPVLYYSFWGPNMNFERGFLWRSSNRNSPGLGLNMAVVGSIVPLTCGIILLHLSALLCRRAAQP